MTTPATWAVLLPIRKQHAANIYAGTKTVELRKTVPHFDPGSYNPAKYPFRVYMYESNSIFFVRHTDAPDLPFFTLQLDTKTGRVMQNRGKGNCERTQEVRDFEEQWLAVIVAPWIQKKTKAARKATA